MRTSIGLQALPAVRAATTLDVHQAQDNLQVCAFTALGLVDWCRTCAEAVVRKAWEEEKVADKWAASSWSKRMQMKAKREGLNDFDRFKLMKAKSARNKIVAKAVAIKRNKTKSKK